MELSSFSSMSLFFLHLLLVLKVLFYNWTIPAQLQWLHRAGLRLWRTGDLFRQILLAKLLLSSLFLKVQSCGKGGSGGSRQELHKSRESGMPNPADGKFCCFWGKDSYTFPGQILLLIVALCGEVLHLAELCARHLRNQTPAGRRYQEFLCWWYPVYPSVWKANNKLCKSDVSWKIKINQAARKCSRPHCCQNCPGKTYQGAEWLQSINATSCTIECHSWRLCILNGS